MTKRRNFSGALKAAVTLEGMRGANTMQGIAAKRQLRLTQVNTWELQTIEGMANVNSNEVKKAENNRIQLSRAA